MILALSRAVMPIPFISGHALFLTYAIMTLKSQIALWVAIAVLIDVAYTKIALRDPTLIGGIAVGLFAALLVRQISRHSARFKEHV
jgi:hypothetical protein